MRTRTTATALVGLAVAGTMTLTACGSSSEDASASGPGEIVIYTPQGDTLRADYVTEHAKSELGLDVKIVPGAGGDLTTRLIAEKNNPQADVVVGIGEAQLNTLADAGVLSGHTPAWSDKIPDEFSAGSDDFTLLTQTPIVLSYNADQIEATDAPAAWTDLAKPEYKGKYYFPPLESQTGQAALVGILWRFADPSTGEVSEEGWDTAETIVENAYPLPEGQSLDWNQVKSGKLPIVVNWLGGIQLGESDNQIDMEVLAPEGGSPFVSTGIAEVAGTDDAEDVERFIDWFGSAEFQAGYVNATKNDTPLNADAVKQIPGAAEALAPIEKQDIDWAVVSKQLTEWLQKIQLG